MCSGGDASALSRFGSFVDVLRARGAEQPDHTAFVFLRGDDSREERVTYAELDRRARAIAAVLRSHASPGDRAVLLYPSGLDFVAAFFGCLYSGIVAVPAYPPVTANLRRTLPRLQSIVADAQARTMLTGRSLLSMADAFAPMAPELGKKHWLATDSVLAGSEDRWVHPRASRETLALLQYTSGSTGSPKGVMVSHGNLLANAVACCTASNHDVTRACASWVPQYHDMGLMGGIVCPVWLGSTSVLMSPQDFLQSPLRWLAAISKYRVQSSAGPNFGYELCTSRISPEDRRNLDLSSWKWAGTGAEPVRPETLDRFMDAFGACGFRPEAFCPSYGLAEATLLVSGGEPFTLPVIERFDPLMLATGRVRRADPDAPHRRIVSCGFATRGSAIAIVDPRTRRRCASDRIGEIWVSGPSVACGYWRRPEETKETFQARLAGTAEGPFLRTGDLGFILDDQLYVAGRLKDFIIIRGTNYYPQDVETAVEGCHPALRRGCSAAFSIEVDGEEQLAVAVEVERRQVARRKVPRPGSDDRRKAGGRVRPVRLGASPYIPDEIFARIRRAIFRDFGITPHVIVLLAVGTVPKTSSGKIQRHACKRGYADSTLSALATWSHDPTAHQRDMEPTLARVAPPAPRPPIPTAESAPVPETTRTTMSVEELQRWSTSWISQRLGVSPSSVGVDVPLVDLGLDSLGGAELAKALQSKVGQKVPATVAWSAVSIAGLARMYAGDVRSGACAPERPVVPSQPATSVAIVGMACRFPGGANTPEAFWRLLDDGVDTITEVPAERWDWRQFYHSDPATAGCMVSRWGGFVGDPSRFDAAFFGISPREAESMDPQQRLLLEVTWEALEHAGIVPGHLAGSRTGVFLGISSSDYSLRAMGAGHPENITPFTATGCSASVAAGRVAYVLGLQGPCVAIDTACSSSLVAVHQACRSLQATDSHLAIAAGVSLMLSPEASIALSQMRALSPSGRCRTFDARADGYVRGEGCGVVVLKRLPDALANGNQILAVIRGSSVNHDGRSNGLTAPNGNAQEQVIRLALADANVDPDGVDFVETHGTGTALGDPIEVGALEAAYGKTRSPDQPLVLGALKTNVGHLEAAAGVAALIKTVLALCNSRIPRNLHFEQVNPYINWRAFPVRLPTQSLPWMASERPRRAGVSAFGISGTNAHIILEEAPRDVIGDAHEEAGAGTMSGSAVWPLLVSGKTEGALRAQAARLAEHMTEHSDVPLRDICYSLATTRTHFGARLALPVTVEHGPDAVIEALTGFGSCGSAPAAARVTSTGRPAGKLAFLFTGQGAQTPGMGRGLYDVWRTFRDAFDACVALFDAELCVSLRGVMWAEPGAAEALRLDETHLTQAALFTLEYALAALWRSWGVEPDLVLGHSIGELVAACVTGVFSLEDATRLVAARGRLMQALVPGGAMVAVEVPEAEARAAIAQHSATVSIAAVNGPASVVIAGARTSVAAIADSFARHGIRTKQLNVSHAFHSPLMDPMLDAYQRVAESIVCTAPSIPFASNVTGEFVTQDVTRSSYWVRQTREAVRFADGIRTLSNAGARTFVEIGPTATLLGLVPANLSEQDSTLLASLRRGCDDVQTVLEALGHMWVDGREVSWERTYPAAARRVTLPAYAWQRARYWLDGSAPSRPAQGSAGVERDTAAGPGVRETPSVGGTAMLGALLAADPAERARLVRESLCKTISAVLRLPIERVNVDTPLREMGMDSLMAFEVRRRVESDTSVKLPFAALVQAPTVEGLTRYVVEQLDAARPDDLSSSGPREAPAERVRPAPQTFVSHDGMTIHGHLSLPDGAAPYPAVVVHTADTGGALDADGHYLRLGEHAPLLAAGYAVFTVDQRGAPGHGLDYLSRSEVGDGDVEDVIAATRYLMGRSDIDEHCVFMMGSSRGAYAVLLAATRADLWRGIILAMGFYDPLAYARHEWSTRRDTSPLRVALGGKDWDAIFAHFGDPRRQPLTRVGSVRVPVLALHGSDDRTVPIGQAEELRRVASKVGVTFSLETVPGLGHDIYYQRENLWTGLWARIVSFLLSCVEQEGR